jgi:hypothetical protein
VQMSERKHKQLREEVLSDIRLERSEFENMVQRAQIAGALPDAVFRERLAEVGQRAIQATDADELDRLVERAFSSRRRWASRCLVDRPSARVSQTWTGRKIGRVPPVMIVDSLPSNR